jgi:hypothetical protein
LNADLSLFWRDRLIRGNRVVWAKLGVQPQDIEERQSQRQQGAPALYAHGMGSSAGNLPARIVPHFAWGFKKLSQR